MTRDEIATKLIITELTRDGCVVKLTDPIPQVWTSFPPPAIITLVDTVLWISDQVLKEKK